MVHGNVHLLCDMRLRGFKILLGIRYPNIELIRSVDAAWDILHMMMHVVVGRDFTLVSQNTCVYSTIDDHGLTTRLMLGVRPVYFPFSAKVQQLSANEENVDYVMESGEVITYGHNSVFSCGHGKYNSVLKPKFVEYFWNTNTPCKQVEVNTMCTIFLTIEGHLYTVRDNKYEQLGLED
ncbi:hypothetical protein YC2023_068876 [Brassica napus]